LNIINILQYILSCESILLADARDEAGPVNFLPFFCYGRVKFEMEIALTLQLAGRRTNIIG